MKLLLIIAVILFSTAASSVAHPVLPEPVMNFIWENPRATDSEINEWLQQNATYDIDDTREMMTMLRDLTDEQLQEIAADTGNAPIEQVGNTTKANSWWQQVKLFVHQGIIHILEGPDHVLFVLALLLIPMATWQLVKVVTTFTIAHSITLLLAGLELVNISSAIVEPAIALSIAYVALSSVLLPAKHWANAFHNRLAVVFGFGLFHGLGFASVFGDLRLTGVTILLPLLGFNIGVEVGQLCIVGIALPLLNEVRKLQLSTVCIKICAMCMSLVALWWFFERIL